MNTIINTKTTIIIIITKKQKSEFVTQTNDDANGKIHRKNDPPKMPQFNRRAQRTRRRGRKASVEFQFEQRLNFNFCARYCLDNMYIKLMIMTTMQYLIM